MDKSTVISWIAILVSFGSLYLAYRSYRFSIETRNDPLCFTIQHDRVLSCKSLIREMADIATLVHKTKHDSPEFRDRLLEEAEELRRCWAEEMLLLDGFGDVTQIIGKFWLRVIALRDSSYPLKDDQFTHKTRAIYEQWQVTWDALRSAFGLESGAVPAPLVQQ